MVAVLVQSASNTSTSAATLAVGSGQSWASPTSGNLLVAWANADTTVTLAGWTAGPSVVDGNGVYLWWKVSAGTETSVTFTTGGTGSPVTVGLMEYSGVSATPTDVQSSSTISGVSGTVTTSVSVTATGSIGDLLIAVAGLHGSTVAATSPAWTNSFTNRMSVGPVGGLDGSTNAQTFVADFQNIAAATVSTSASWTGAYFDRQELLIAFKLAAGGAPAAANTGVGTHRHRPGRGPASRRGHRRGLLATDAVLLPSAASLVSTLDAIATDLTAPTTGNSNISATANNAAPTLYASTDLPGPHGGATVQKYTQSVGTAALAVWDTAKWTTPPTGLTVYSRFYLWVAVVPGSTIGLSAIMNGSFTASSSVRVTSGNRLTAYATSSVQLGTMTSTMPTGRWIRVESKTFMDASVGYITIRLFLTPESVTPDEEYTSPTGNTLNAQSAIQRVGIGNIGSGSTATHYFADAAWSDTNWVGPMSGYGGVAPFTGWGWGQNG